VPDQQPLRLDLARQDDLDEFLGAVHGDLHRVSELRVFAFVRRYNRGFESVNNFSDSL
jgi:hypothetical protein